jgi:hypothetical protein
MSHFACDKCGVTQVDSPQGYIAGCCHHPPEDGRTVVLKFGGDGRFDRTGFYVKSHGAFYANEKSMNQRAAVHPVEWCDIPF